MVLAVNVIGEEKEDQSTNPIVRFKEGDTWLEIRENDLVINKLDRASEGRQPINAPKDAMLQCDERYFKVGNKGFHFELVLGDWVRCHNEFIDKMLGNLEKRR